MTAWLFAVAAFASATLASQTTPVKRPTFEVASVKESLSESGGGTIAPRGDRFVATNIPLRGLLNFAYAPPAGVLLSSQIVGGPEWTNTMRFDIEAKMDVSAGAIPRAEIQLMLLALLEDRFQLKAHRETRELPVFDLVVARGGLRIKESDDQSSPSGGFIQYDSTGQQNSPLPRGAMRISGGAADTTLTAMAVPISKLVALLQSQADRIIIDKTNVARLFDIRLRYSRELRAGLLDESSLTLSGPPSFFTAIEDLGLKLEPSKAMLDVVVIDSVQKPKQN
jgi:uncharacterized protein (TIGR03435 family)